MKKNIVLIILLALNIFVSSCGTSPQKQLVGEWLGTDSEGETASLFFNEDGSAKMIRENVVLDGSTSGRNLTWKLNANIDPMHLDLVISEKSDGIIVLPMICRFIGDNKLQVRIDEDMKSRPDVFLESVDKNQIIFTRQ
ncbi:MAG: hypothetical protein WD708_12780 [Kiritimatiellia bacterium]